MKVKIGQKDIVGYLFMLVWATACIIIGIKILASDHPVSGAFGLGLGVLLTTATAFMVLRKD